jgi:uncharacterized protein YqgC (DUF456 family)
VVALIVLGGVSLFAGIVGSILPILPGPPLAYLSLILVSLGRGWEAYSTTLLVILGAVTVAVTIADYVLPAAVSRRRGASKAATVGSLLGMIAGILLFPPFGMLIGSFAGAVLGELAFGKDKRKSLKAGWGVLLGTLLSMSVKLGLCGFIGFYYVRGAIG